MHNPEAYSTTSCFCSGGVLLLRSGCSRAVGAALLVLLPVCMIVAGYCPYKAAWPAAGMPIIDLSSRSMLTGNGLRQHL